MPDAMPHSSFKTPLMLIWLLAICSSMLAAILWNHSWYQQHQQHHAQQLLLQHQLRLVRKILPADLSRLPLQQANQQLAALLADPQQQAL